MKGDDNMNNDESIRDRKIQTIWTPEERTVSPIHTVAPILEPGNWKQYDPFLLMMKDKFGKGAFDVHPHRGIETVTFVIDGTIHHYDSKSGNTGALHAGDAQWMTAGRGVVHNETPAEGEQVHVLQLWVNLPREHKMTEPRYQDLRAAEMPVREEEGALIRVFSGSSGNVRAKTLNYAPVTFVELQLEAGASIVQDLPSSYNGFIYVLEGSGTFGANQVEASKGQAMQLDYDADADESDSVKSGVRVTAKERMRAILFAGEPLREPVVARGPFVMNTEEEKRPPLRGRFVRVTLSFDFCSECAAA